MPQFNYTMPRLSLGQVQSTTSNAGEIDSYENELFAQVSTFAIGGITDGTYTIQIDGPEGTFQFSFVASGNTADQIAAGLVTAANDDPDIQDILVATGAATPGTLTFRARGQVYTLTAVSAPSSITFANTTSAGGTDIPLAVGVVQGTTDTLCALPTGATVDADFIGISERSLFANVSSGVQTAVDVFEPGATVSAMVKGDIVVFAEDAVTKNAQVFMRIQNPGPNQSLGGFRSDADGGDAIALTGAVWRTSTTSAGLAVVRLNRPA